MRYEQETGHTAREGIHGSAVEGHRSDQSEGSRPGLHRRGAEAPEVFCLCIKHIGGAVGGAIAGAAHAGTTAAVALSPYTWPVYLGEGFGGLMIGCAVGAAITFVLTCIMGIDETVE